MPKLVTVWITINCGTFLKRWEYQTILPVFWETCMEVKKQESSRKTPIFALLTMPTPLTLWLTINCGTFLKRWEYQTTWPASWEIYMQVRRQQLELDMEQQIDSKLGKEYIKAVYCYPAYLTYMQSTSWDILDWMKHKLESNLQEEISVTSDVQMTPPLWQKAKRS